MRERITIDVTRTTGTRSASVRVSVAPQGGDPGSAYRYGSVRLSPEQRLDHELAQHLAHALEGALRAYEHLLRESVPYELVELPLG